jgi:hypothetical protein
MMRRIALSPCRWFSAKGRASVLSNVERDFVLDLGCKDILKASFSPDEITEALFMVGKLSRNASMSTEYEIQMTTLLRIIFGFEQFMVPWLEEAEHFSAPSPDDGNQRLPLSVAYVNDAAYAKYVNEMQPIEGVHPKLISGAELFDLALNRKSFCILLNSQSQNEVMYHLTPEFRDLLTDALQSNYLKKLILNKNMDLSQILHPNHTFYALQDADAKFYRNEERQNVVFSSLDLALRVKENELSADSKSGQVVAEMVEDMLKEEEEVELIYNISSLYEKQSLLLTWKELENQQLLKKLLHD